MVAASSTRAQASPGNLPPALSPERIRIAREIHGDEAVDRYLANLYIGDPLADALMLPTSELSAHQVDRLLHQAITHGVDAVDDPPPALTALFAELDHVPSWVDWREMRHASGRILRSGMLTGLAFAAYALPHSYLATANRPLAFTGRLLRETARRYGRTVRFVLESFLPDGLRRDADGFRMAVIVRVMHARVRLEILRTGRWDAAGHGVPLNQSHTAMNSVFFSLYVVDGLRRLGVRLNRRERDSVMMTWRYLNHLLGVSPDIGFRSEGDARALADVAFSLEFDPDETSRKLYRAMIESGPEYMHIRDERLARMFTGVVRPMSRYLLGPGMADRLGHWSRPRPLLCRTVIALIRLTERWPGLLPDRIRNFMGLEFWLRTGDYGALPWDRPSGRDGAA